MPGTPLPDWLHHAMAECESADDALITTISRTWVGLSAEQRHEVEQDARISKASSALALRDLASGQDGSLDPGVLALLAATAERQLDELHGVPLVASAVSTERFLAQVVVMQGGAVPPPTALASRFGL